MSYSDYLSYSPAKMVAAQDVQDAALLEEQLSDRRSPYVRQLTQRLIAMENENARLLVKNQTLVQELKVGGDKGQLTAQIASLQSKIAQLETDNAELRARSPPRAMSPPQVQDRSAEIGELQASLDQQNAMYKSLQAQLAQKDGQIMAMDSDLKALQKKIADKDKEIADFKRLDGEKAEMVKRTRELEQNLEQRTNEVNRWQREALTSQNELKGVGTWWAKKNSGCMSKKDDRPWKSDVPPMGPLPGPEPLRRATISGADARAVPVSGATGTPVPYIGMGVRQNPGQSVVFVTGVDPNSPAADATITQNDQIVKMGDMPTNSIGAFRDALKTYARIGNKIPVILAASQGAGPQRSSTITVGSRIRQAITNLMPMKTAEDLEAILANPAELQKTSLAAFYACDKDQSGVIEPQELQTGVRAFFPPEMAKWITDEDVRNAFDKGDSDRSGYLVGGEFVPVLEFLMRQMIKNSRSTTAAQQGRPWIGFAIKSDTATKTLKLKDVVDGGPASVCGLQDGDTIVSFGGANVNTLAQFRDAVSRSANVVGAKVPMQITRGGTPLSRELVVGIKQKQVFNNLPPLRTTADLQAALNNPADMSVLSQAAFQHADDDLSGLVTRQELSVGLRSWLIPSLADKISDAELLALFDASDDDKSGYLVKSEFQPFLEKLFREIIRRG